MITPGVKLTFPKADLESLGREVSVMVDELSEAHAPMFKELAIQWENYDAEPLTRERSTPWRGASNIVVPTIAIHADATIARYLALITASPDPWSGRSDNEEFVNAGFAREIPRFLNHEARNSYDFHGPITDHVTETVVVGSSLFTQGWETKDRLVTVGGRRGGRLDTRNVRIRRGPVLRHIPRERALWDINFPAWGAPLIAISAYISWPDMIRRVNEDGWDELVVDELKGSVIGGSVDSGVEIARGKAERQGILMDPILQNNYHFIEVWVDWPVAKQSINVDGPEEMEAGDQLTTLVLHMHRDSGKIVKVTNKPYAIPDNPFYDSYFKKRSGQYTSPGIARLLRDMQSGGSAIFNQAIDVIALSNSLPGFTTDARLARAKFQLGVWQKVDSEKAFIPANLSKLVAPDMQVFAQLNVLAERRTGVNDPALGRETRMGGHPAPATSTLKLLQEGRRLDIIAMRSIRSAISKMGLDQATLYQQFEVDDGKIERSIGTKDGAIVKKWMFPDSGDAPIIGNLELELSAVTESMNPQVDQQKALLSFQATSNYYNLVEQQLAIIANPQMPPQMRMVVMKAIEGLTKSFELILESNDVDEIEAYTLNLQQLTGAGGGGAGGVPPSGGGPGVGGGNGAAAGPQAGVGGPLGSGLG